MKHIPDDVRRLVTPTFDMPIMADRIGDDEYRVGDEVIDGAELERRCAELKVLPGMTRAVGFDGRTFTENDFWQRFNVCCGHDPEIPPRKYVYDEGGRCRIRYTLSGSEIRYLKVFNIYLYDEPEEVYTYANPEEALKAFNEITPIDCEWTFTHMSMIGSE